MRPIRLEMEGFASFRTQTTVDFAGADYFALVGPTGSGKSTVIDAMTFALFGSAPRWGRTNAVQYALAPTATRATVRLVFDVGAERFQIAREVRRIGKGNPIQRSVSLEKFDDPTQTTATTDEVEVLASEVRAMTPAVERLLGLSFDDFTKAVVLPQGQFAEFLAATSGDRQTILLKLLGAHHYDRVMRSAGVRKTEAEREVVAAEAKAEALGGATEEAEAAAVARVAQLEGLGSALTGLWATVEMCRGEASRAGDALVAAVAAVDTLTAVRIPDGVADVAERALAARSEAERLRAAAVGSEGAWLTARAALEAGGDRGALERQRDAWHEAAAVEQSLPELSGALDACVASETAAADASVDADREWEAAFAAEADARGVVTAAESSWALANERRSVLDAVTAPDGVDELASRLDAASSEVERCTDDLAEAELADEAAGRAVLDAGDPVDLHRAETRLDAAERLAERAVRLRGEVARAEARVAAAELSAESAQSDVDRARRVVEQARTRATAAALRAGLSVGHACPVCDTTVEVLPGPADASPDVDLGARLAEVEARARSTSNTLAAATAEASARASEASEVMEALEEFDGVDLVAWRAEIEGREGVLADATSSATSARERLQEARRGLVRARGALTALDADRAAAVRLLRETVASVGAPVSVAGWHELESWVAGELSVLDATTLPAAQAAFRESGDLHRAAAAALAASVDRRTQASEAAKVAHRTLSEAQSALARAQRRQDDLAAMLTGAPTSAEVEAALARVGALELAERAALAEFQAAGKARDAAVAAETASRDDLAEAGRLLHATRRPLVGLGAPAVDESDLAGAWMTFAEWAREATSSANDAMVAAHEASLDATHTVTQAEAEVVAAAIAAGLEVASADRAKLVLETAAARASDLLDRIRIDRARLRELDAERGAASERASVAGALADHLSARKFQRWLAGAALDLLVEAASASLLELSGGQFGLTHEKGDFYVIDHADAEARRSVRTLSGGETFQASLALALALSAELSSMSSAATRLDSIFLDEGFGSLDPDSLEVVALTLERLAQGDRMVGVVTHVQALAERVPTRFVVARNSRTSSVVREG